MKFRLHIIAFLAGISLVFNQCTKEKIVILSDEKEILTFSLREVDVTAQWDGQILYLVSHEPVDVSKPLTPYITVSKDAILYPPSGTPQIFSELGVKYVVVAPSGNAKEFFVKLRVLDSEKEILSFTIPNKTTRVVFNENHIDIEVYAFVDVTNLTPIITCSPMATISPKSGEVVDFSNPVTYTVTAQERSTTDYTVTVTKSLSRRNEIEQFELIGTQQIFEREGDRLFIYVPYETDVTKIRADIVISDLATVRPENGEFFDFTNPQIYTVTASDGASRDYLVTVKKSPWKLRNAAPEFSIRDGASLLEFKNKFWLIGGYKHGYDDGIWWGHVCSEVWNSNDGLTWEYITTAPWSDRHCHGTVVFNDALWVISGDAETDVWKSEDGINWTLITNKPPWRRRYAPYVAVFKNKLWLMGGISWWDNNGNTIANKSNKAYNDVWSSEDGKNWILENPVAGWSPRGLIHGYVVLNDEMYIMGGGVKGYETYPTGETNAEYNDVWKTSDGIHWKQVLQHAPWSPRTHFSITTYNGNIILNDGSVGVQAGLSNETWYSSNGGRDWKQVKYSFWTPTHASSLAVFNNQLWLVGGFWQEYIWSLDFNNF